MLQGKLNERDINKFKNYIPEKNYQFPDYIISSIIHKHKSIFLALFCQYR